MTVVICFRLKMQDCPFESGTCPYGITFDRNYEDILLEAESAKLGDTTTYSNSIVCAASSAANETPTASIESFKIFQLSEQQTQMLLSNSSSFTIKTGPENDNCMVFTDDKSFTIKSSETSNSLLFLSNLYPSTSEIFIPFVSLVELASISSKCRKRFKSRKLCLKASLSNVSSDFCGKVQVWLPLGRIRAVLTFQLLVLIYCANFLNIDLSNFRV